MSQLIIIGIICTPGCAQRPKQLIEKKISETPIAQRMSLPAVRNVTFCALQHGIKVSWRPLTLAHDDGELVGYILYRCAAGSCIPQSPCHEEYLIEPHYVDHHAPANTEWWYRVRGVLKINGKLCETPASHLARVATKKVPPT